MSAYESDLEEGKEGPRPCEKLALTCSPARGFAPAMSVPSALALSGKGQDILEPSLASLGQCFTATKSKIILPWQGAPSHRQVDVEPGRRDEDGSVRPVGGGRPAEAELGSTSAPAILHLRS